MPKFPRSISEEHLYLVVTESYDQIRMVIAVHIVAHEGHRGAMDRIVLPLLKFPVPMTKEYFDFVAAGASQRHISVVVVIEVVHDEGSWLLTHMELDMILKRAVTVPK